MRVMVAIVLCLALVPVAAGAGGITDDQAVAFIKAGKGLPGLNGKKPTGLPAKERPYALRVYKSGPYRKPAMNLFYAVGATVIHFGGKKQKQNLMTAITLLGRHGVEDQMATSVKKPQTVRRFGVTVRQFAIAVVRGMVTGALD